MSDGLIRILSAAEEAIDRPSYHWRNIHRSDGGSVLQWTLEGEAFFRRKGQEHRVGPNEAMLFSMPDDSEYGYPPDATTVYRQMYITFDGGPSRQVASSLVEGYGNVFRFEHTSEAAVLARQIVDTFRENRWRDRFEQSERVYALLMVLSRQLARAAERSDPVTFCYHYMQNHHRDRFSFKELAARTQVSREHLSREFAERYGSPPAAYLRNLRLETAMNLLRTTTMPLDQVARASGFGSANMLCRVVQKLRGTTPEGLRDRDRRAGNDS